MSIILNLELDNEGPLYAQIERAIAQQIAGGHLKPGDALPFEQDLTRQIGTSRMTVNRALTALARRGLVTRVRRKGTFVAKPVTAQAPLMIRDIKDDVEHAGGVYAYRLLSQQSTIHDVDGIKTRVLALKCLHLKDASPCLLESRRINLDAVPEAGHVDFEHNRPGQWLLENVPWSEAEHKISAVNASLDISTVLALQPASACLQLERRTWREDVPLTAVTLTYPGHMHSFIGRFEPGR